MEKRPPTDPLHFGDTSTAGSSIGWTDEKHMLYISFLEESFVNQLYSGNREINSTESFYRTPAAWQKNSYSGNGMNTKYDQGQRCWGMVKVDGAESRLSEVGYIGSPSCSGGSPYCMDDDASTNGPRHENVTGRCTRQRNSGGSSAFHFRPRHSFSWRTESSDQNFFDGETPKVAGNEAEGPAKNSKDMLIQERLPHLEAQVFTSTSGGGGGNLGPISM